MPRYRAAGCLPFIALALCLAPSSARAQENAWNASANAVFFKIKAGAAYQRLQAPEARTGDIALNIYDGTRRLMAPGIETLIRLIDAGTGKEVLSRFVSGPIVLIKGLPYHDNFKDAYSIVVSLKGYKQGGIFPVKLSSGKTVKADVMVLPKNGKFDFSQASWPALQESDPELIALLSAGLPQPAARQRYETLMAQRPNDLAALLNITTALSQIRLDGQDWLSYLKELDWDHGMEPYGFGAWADAAVAQRIAGAVKAGQLSSESLKGFFHPGSTLSVKQHQLPNANVHFIVFGNQRRVIDGVKCVFISVHIDAYRGVLHAGEVAKWYLKHELTDPKTIYQLRWNAAQEAGLPDFDPHYTIR